MIIKRSFTGKDYALGRWFLNLLRASDSFIEMQDSFRLDGCEIVLTYDNVKIKKMIKKAYNEMQRGNI